VFGVLDSVAWYVNSADNIDIPSVIVVHSVLSTALAAIIAGLMSFSRRRYESRGRT
jgi:hypothetical protein